MQTGLVEEVCDLLYACVQHHIIFLGTVSRHSGPQSRHELTLEFPDRYIMNTIQSQVQGSPKDHE